MAFDGGNGEHLQLLAGASRKRADGWQSRRGEAGAEKSSSAQRGTRTMWTPNSYQARVARMQQKLIAGRWTRVEKRQSWDAASCRRNK